MRDGFEEYFDLSEEDIKDLWGSAVFVFDTNALLSLFRDKKSTSDDLMNIIKKLKNRVWVPHQVAWEFHKNRSGVVIGNKKVYQPLRNAIDAARKVAEDTVRKNMDGYKHHPVMSVTDAITFINEKFDRIISDIGLKEEASPRDDHYRSVFKVLVDALEKSTGQKYSDKDLEGIYEDGKCNCEKLIPPGYIDYQKKQDRPVEERLGDYILWRQMVDYAVAERKPIIFITDDVKEDWWREVKGEKIGPRIELVREFMSKTNQRFHAYTRYRFLEMASEHLNVSVKNETIIDVKKTTVSTDVDNNKSHRPLYDKSLSLLEKMKIISEVGNSIKSSTKDFAHFTNYSARDRAMLERLEEEKDILLRRYHRANDYHRLSVVSGDKNSISEASLERYEAMMRVDRITSKIEELRKKINLQETGDDGDDSDHEDFMD
ncbi:hypothetical protein FBZ83_12359 [Azospirillum brasilense]|uniref:PIN like domain-containing protein n=1 Tax=Azospirillum brasilense TaxID=192 RepID=A0A560BSP8_AZOBR|nr:PIN domain-containing protein [Azospirillum brasilense]TWA75632.1 hypothetical protein FBZ83_12359 [Azospirillum brasilense]